ncbi:hypothetical protein [Bdellovibrio sp. BCCA]|uniref:hypothetical protein n=1 Tax=Bdellovibrio sp. BCCA TaxID=3136281 RepID=UPI0030F328ED
MKLGLILKVSMLLLALVVVIYGIKALQSPKVQTQAGDPSSVVGLLLGGDQRLLNWCPGDTAKVEIFSETGEVLKTLTSKQDLSAVCELMIGGFTQDPAETPVYKLKLKAYPGSGNPVSLEKAVQSPIFRVQGMPFSSPGLVKVLERLAVP